MRLVRSSGSWAESRVRAILLQSGVTFRMHDRKLPGSPDFVMVRRRSVIFVNGCFWHQHKGCRGSRMPKTHLSYWEPKLARNESRDLQVRESLGALGWRVLDVWECECGDTWSLRRRVVGFVAKQPNPSITFRVSPEALRHVKAVRRRQRISLSAAVRRVLLEGLVADRHDETAAGPTSSAKSGSLNVSTRIPLQQLTELRLFAARRSVGVCTLASALVESEAVSRGVVASHFRTDPLKARRRASGGDNSVV